MQAIILAGGFGTRLRPLTYTVPKPLLPVANMPALQNTIERLADAKFSEVIITTNFLADTITDCLGELTLPIPVRCVKEESPLGTAGCIKNVIDDLDEIFLVIQGDAVADLDYAGFAAFAKSKNADVAISAMRVGDTREFGVIDADESGRILRFQEKPRPEEAFSNLANSGFYMVKKAVFDDVPRGEPHDFSRQLFPRLMQQGALFYAWEQSSYWIDIGRINNYLEGNLYRIKGRAEIAPGVEIPESATLVPPFLIAAGTKLGDGCVLGPHAIVGKDCTIGARAHVSGSVLFHGVKLGEDVRLSDCVVASNSRLGKGASVEPMAVIGEGCDIGERVQVRAHSKVGPVMPVVAGTVVDGVISPRMEKIEGLQRVLESTPSFAHLSPEELRVCALLAEFGELTARAIAEGSGVAFSKVHSTLHGLDTQNIVLSTPDMPKRYALAHEPAGARI